ncbi:MAG: hypothetical protein WCQ21_32250, partial [Verrucomicrobiota bacterium]
QLVRPDRAGRQQESRGEKKQSWEGRFHAEFLLVPRLSEQRGCASLSRIALFGVAGHPLGETVVHRHCFGVWSCAWFAGDLRVRPSVLADLQPFSTGHPVGDLSGSAFSNCNQIIPVSESSKGIHRPTSCNLAPPDARGGCKRALSVVPQIPLVEQVLRDFSQDA